MHKEMKRRRVNGNPQLGLTLIEILIALAILGLAATFITGRIMQNLYEGQVRTTQIQIGNIKARLKEYNWKCGHYPTTAQGLQSLIVAPTSEPVCKRYPPGGFIDGDKLPKDAWDNDFIYESDGNKITALKSAGKEGEEITEDTPKL